MQTSGLLPFAFMYQCTTTHHIGISTLHFLAVALSMGTFFGSSVASKRSGLASSCCQTGFKNTRFYGKFVFLAFLRRDSNWAAAASCATLLPKPHQELEIAEIRCFTSLNQLLWHVEAWEICLRPKVVQSLKMIRVANAPENDQAEVPSVNTKTWIPARLTDLTKASGMRYPCMGLNI